MIPVFGSSVAALTSLLGAVLFPPNTTDKLWEQLHERIETLIDKKIGESQIKVLQKKIKGLQDNMHWFSQYVNGFQSATGDQKDKAGESLHMYHIGFLEVVRAAMPEL